MAAEPQREGMSPLARFLHRLRADGLSFGEMSKIAIRKGHDLSVSRISQIAADEPRRRLPQDMVKALAAATGESPTRIAVLDDQRWGIARGDIEGTGDDLADEIRNDRGLSDEVRELLLAQHDQQQRAIRDLYERSRERGGRDARTAP